MVFLSDSFSTKASQATWRVSIINGLLLLPALLCWISCSRIFCNEPIRPEVIGTETGSVADATCLFTTGAGVSITSFASEDFDGSFLAMGSAADSFNLIMGKARKETAFVVSTSFFTHALLISYQLHCLLQVGELNEYHFNMQFLIAALFVIDDGFVKNIQRSDQPAG